MPLFLYLRVHCTIDIQKSSASSYSLHNNSYPFCDSSYPFCYSNYLYILEILFSKISKRDERLILFFSI